MKKENKHGVRAPDKTQTSISLRTDLLEAARRAAEEEGRSFSNWLEQMLKEKTAIPRPKSSKPSAKRGPDTGV